MNLNLLLFFINTIRSEITSREDFLQKFNTLNSPISNLDTIYKQQILNTIYDIMGKGNQKKFTLFVTVSLFNTKYFKKFVDYDDKSIFKKRGLLGIKGEKQYRLLSCYNNNYYDNYELAGSTMYHVIEDLSYFFDCMLNFEYTIEKYYEVMELGEMERMNDRPDVRAMRQIYYLLKKAFKSKIKN